LVAACLSFFPQRELNFLFLGEVRPFCILGQNIPQIKHETGHVHLRVLREIITGQNSLRLSGSTVPIAREVAPVRFVAAGSSAEARYPTKQNAKAISSLWPVDLGV
jgi:hypothetical protein